MRFGLPPIRRHPRWLVPALLLVLLLVLAAIWQTLRDSPGRTRTQVLREAFEQASNYCYTTYAGRELQGCLLGAMQAHLQALGGHNAPPAALGVKLPPRGDI